MRIRRRTGSAPLPPLTDSLGNPVPLETGDWLILHRRPKSGARRPYMKPVKLMGATQAGNLVVVDRSGRESIVQPRSLLRAA
jgi:hypothetical protein